MTTTSPQDLKKALIAEGFEVFRILEGHVILADRVRENLILDSGVRVAPEPLAILAVFRVQQSDFPSEDESALFERARGLAACSREKGFSETTAVVAPVFDPADATRVLDTFYEVTMCRSAESFTDAVNWLKIALAFEKAPAE